MIERLGLSDFFPRTMRIESPFSYDERMQVMIPKEMKSIQDTGQPEFIQDTARYIELMQRKNSLKFLCCLHPMIC